MRKGAEWNKKFCCTGENYRADIPIGDCGDVRTLSEWAERFFKDESGNFFERFKYSKTKDIVDHIYLKTGKRLESVAWIR